MQGMRHQGEALGRLVELNAESSRAARSSEAVFSAD
jgi:hypothetical protein